jgi:polysaccharide deacetylase family protein (PEP-CTERM system associated)
MKVLTFDVEEWFHILDHEGTRSEKEWACFDYRLDANMDNILEILDRHNQKATFFCLGWLTKKHAHIVKRLDSLGYEIATHSHMHQLVYEQKISEFEKDLEYSIKSLEDITGKKIRAYRAPGFSLKQENRWVFDVLLSHGIEIDCSIFPARRAHGGFEKYGTDKPSLVISNKGVIKEFPMSIDRILFKNIVSSGGGYFRLLPYPVIRYLMNRADYSMSYFHPHDFDAERPLIPGLSPVKRFKTRVGLKGALKKLENLIEDFNFVDLNEAVERIDWEQVSVVHLPERRKLQRGKCFG